MDVLTIILALIGVFSAGVFIGSVLGDIEQWALGMTLALFSRVIPLCTLLLAILALVIK